MIPTIRSKPFIQNLSHDITSPFFDSNRNLHFICQNSGEIMMINELEKVERVHMTHGQPSGAIFDQDGALYVTDFAHGAVLTVSSEGGQEVVVGVYEDKPLKGPNTIAQDNRGNFFFTDSGPAGETGLNNTTGSLFAIMNSSAGQILKPLSFENLAYPTGLALSPNGKFIYVAEMMMNRVLRFFEKPAGVYHGSVFVQLNGGIGPSAIICDKNGVIYLAHYDIRESTSEGKVSVIGSNGQIQSQITVGGPEITGLTINGNFLYITEQSTGTIYRVDI